MPATIYSTITNSTRYCFYEKTNDLPILKREVLIKGGANVARRGDLITPYGAATVVSDEELELLESNPGFQAHKDRGFIKVVKRKSTTNPDVVAADMIGRDKSAPLVPQDYEADGKQPPKTGKELPDVSRKLR